MELQSLEKMETRRVRRMKLGLFVGFMGVMAAAVGWLLQRDATVEELAAAKWLMTGGGVATGLGFIWAWINRPGEAARELAAAPGARDRAQRNRARMLSIIPVTMIVFGALSVKAMGAAVSGEAVRPDWILLGTVLLYAWFGPLMVMGWDGAGLRQKALLEDELIRHFRARAVTLAFFVLLIGCTGVVVFALFDPVEALALLPLVMCTAGAAAALRYSWLDREADRDG